MGNGEWGIGNWELGIGNWELGRKNSPTLSLSLSLSPTLPISPSLTHGQTKVITVTSGGQNSLPGA
jgi:hypothetical protein